MLLAFSSMVTLFVYVKRVGENGLWYDGFHFDKFEGEKAIVESEEEPHAVTIVTMRQHGLMRRLI